MNKLQRQTDRETDSDAFLSINDLAERWRMSRTGAIQVLERAGIPSVYLGGRRRGTRRVRLSAVLDYERKCEA
jgi:hypothetical protein